MRKYKVLIPLDGSAFGERILPYVRRHLSPAENELILFHVADPPKVSTGSEAERAAGELMYSMIMGSPSEEGVATAPSTVNLREVKANIAANLATKLQPMVDELRGAGYTVSTEIRFGDPALKIEDACQHEDIDLIAMTTHGRTGLRRAMFGSVAEHVLRHVSAPVLLLRPFAQGSTV